MTDALKPCPARAAIIQAMRDHFDARPPNFDGEWEDGASDAADAILAALPRPVAWLRDAHEGQGDECLVPAAKGDPGAFPVYDSHPLAGLVAVEPQEVIDVIDDAIADSIDEGWRTADGAKAAVKALEALGWVVVGPKEEGRPAADSVPRSAP